MKAAKVMSTDFDLLLSEEIPDAAIIITSAGKILHWSKGAENLFGFASAESLGRNIQDLTVPLDRITEEADLIKQTLDAGHGTFGGLRRRKDGSLLHVDISSKVVRTPEYAEPLVLLTKKDVTQLKIQQATKAMEERCRDLLESVPDAIITVNPTGHIVFVNSQSETLFGYNSGELTGQLMEELLPPRFRGGHIARRASYRLQPRTRAMGTGLDLFGLRKDRSEFPVEVSLSPLRIDHTTMVMCALRDLTERKRIDQALRDREAELAQAQRMEAVGQLTGGIAHDFNNLLTVIKGTVEDIQSDFRGNPDLEKLADLLMQAADRGAGLVRQLLAYARKQELRPSVVDLNTQLTPFVDLLRRTLTENISIRLRGAEKLSLVNVDAGSWENALLNIAINARDAMPDGGTLVIETSNVVFDADYAAENPGVLPGPYVLVSVSDTGTGMTKEVMEHAFEPFFTTKDVDKGTGLGLSMVYGFIKQSGGHAEILSVLNQGTTIKIYLPAAGGLMEPTEPTVARDSKASPRKADDVTNILVVEDDPLVRASVVGKLKRVGYGVFEVGSAAEAIAVLDENAEFDLVFTDLVMPGAMSGAELAREVIRRWPAIKVLATSGYTENAILGKIVLPHGVRLLSKPYSNADLVAAIRDASGVQLDANSGPAPFRSAELPSS